MKVMIILTFQRIVSFKMANFWYKSLQTVSPKQACGLREKLSLEPQIRVLDSSSPDSQQANPTIWKLGYLDGVFWFNSQRHGFKGVFLKMRQRDIFAVESQFPFKLFTKFSESLEKSISGKFPATSSLITLIWSFGIFWNTCLRVLDLIAVFVNSLPLLCRLSIENSGMSVGTEILKWNPFY